ncbi:hypothetical protein B484DRAFT_394296, partial [Ochromonadaceae sp. CCMP2298]
MCDVDEIRRNLRSEKVTIRKKARLECESRLFGDSSAIAFNAVQTMGLLQAGVEWATSEINVSLGKEKDVPVDVSVFFRNLVRYCANCGQLSSRKLGFLFDHVLDILLNEELSGPFKNNFKGAICLLLQPAVTHAVPYEKMQKLFIYLMDAMGDRRAMQDSANHKMLRATARCMVVDDTNDPCVLADILKWFVRMLACSGDPTLHATMTATLADCCAAFLRYQGLNLLHPLHHSLQQVFHAVVKNLSSFHYRDQHRGAYLAFLDSYLGLCLAYRELTCAVGSSSSTATASSSGWFAVVAQLYEVLVSEDHLRYAALTARSVAASLGGASSAALSVYKDGDYAMNALEDPRTRMHFAVIAKTVRLYAGYSPREGSVDVTGGGGVTGTQDAPPPKRQKVSDGSSGSGNTPDESRASPMDRLLSKIESLSVDAGSTRARITSVASSSSSLARQNFSYLLEGYLLLIAAMAVTFPRGDVFDACDSHDALSVGRIVQGLRRCAVVVRGKLDHVLLTGGEPQLVAAALVALTELCGISRDLCAREGAQGELLSLWQEMLAATVNPALIRRCSATTRRDSLAAHTMHLRVCIMQLLSAQAEGAIVHLGSAGDDLCLWRQFIPADPSSVEAPASLEYLAWVVSTGGDIPPSAQAALQEHLSRLSGSGVGFSAEALTDTQGGAQAFSVGTVSAQFVTSYLVAWLFAQLSPYASVEGGNGKAPSITSVASGSARTSLADLGEYASALRSLLCPSFTVCEQKHVYDEDHWLHSSAAISAGHYEADAPGKEGEGEADADSRTVDVATLRVVAGMLEHVKKHLLSIYLSKGRRESDQLSAWQTVAMLVASCYASLMCAASQPFGKGGATDADTGDRVLLHSQLLESFLLLVKAIVSFDRKATAKLGTVGEYFEVLVQSLCAVSSSENQLRRVVKHPQQEQLEGLKTQCQSSFVRAAQEVLSATSAASARPRDDFDSDRARNVKNVVDDDFLESSTGVALEMEEEVPYVRSARSNVLSFDPEQRRAFTTLLRCIFGLHGLNCPAERYGELAEGVGKLIRQVFFTDTSGTTSMLLTDSETKLLLAEALVQMGSAAATTAALALIRGATTLAADWGALGSCKVLKILNDMLRQKAFWDTLTPADKVVEFGAESRLSRVVGLVLEESQDLSYWPCRYMQLLCVKRLFECADMSAAKNDTRQMILNAFSDSNPHVRLLAASTAPLMLLQYSKKLIVYDALLESAGLSLLLSGGEEQLSQLSGSEGDEPERAGSPLDVVALGLSIATMGSIEAPSSTGLVCRALLDLCKLCCSRAKIEVGDGASAICYRSLLHRAVGTMSKWLGYASAPLLVRDHLRPLLREWLRLAEGDENGREGLGLSDFPCSLLTDTPTASQPPRTGVQHSPYRDFLTLYSGYIVQAIVALKSPQVRFAALVQFAVGCGLAGTDNDIAVVIKQNICAIKAVEIRLRCVGRLRGDQAGADEIANLVERSCNAVEMRDYIAPRVTDLLLETVLLHGCEEELEEGEVLVGEAFKSVEALSEHSLTQCNLVDLLCQLQIQLSQSRLESANLAVLAALAYLLKPPTVLSRSLLGAALLLLRTSIAYFPTHLKRAVEVLKDFAALVTAKIVPATTTSTERLYTPSEVVDFLPDLLAELLVILKASKMEGGRGLSGDQLSDDFCAAQYRLVSGDAQVEVVLRGLVGDLLFRTSSTDNHQFLALLLPLPPSYRGFEEESFSLETTLQERMRGLAVLMDRWVLGEVVSLANVWIQLQIVTSLLSDGPGSGESGVSGGSGGSGGSGQCQWTTEVDLLSTFLSTLIGLCNHLNVMEKSAHEGGQGTRMLRVLQPAVLGILGHFGAPDILALNHSKFPAQSADFVLMRRGGFEVKAMKLSLLVSLHGMLWDRNIGQAQAQTQIWAAAAMRDLSCAGYFSSLSLAEASQECESVLSEIVAFYSHTVLPLARPRMHCRAVKTSGSGRISAELWDTALAASYQEWISNLVFHLIDRCYQPLEGAPTSSSSSSSSSAITLTSDPFLAAVKPICLLRSDFAEAVFPLVVFDILRHNGANSYAQSTLTQCVKQLLAPRAFRQATQLACRLLTFLLRQDISDFLVQGAQGAPRVAPPESKTALDWALPYSYILGIDFKYAASAASRCQLTCTALLFAGLGVENRQEERYGGGVGDGQAMEVEEQSLVSRPGGVTPEMHSLLLPIYQDIHDPDAIYGIDMSADLGLQALMYSRRGRWMEALTTYEGIIQTHLQEQQNGQGQVDEWRPGMAMATAEAGIVEALRALGAQHTLQQFLQGGVRAGQQLSQWHGPADAPSLPDELSSQMMGQMGMGQIGGVNILGAGGASRTGAGLVMGMGAGVGAGVGAGAQLGSSIEAALRYLARGEYAAAAGLVHHSSESLFGGILGKMGEETAVNVLADLSQAQQLAEIREVCALLAQPAATAPVEAKRGAARPARSSALVSPSPASSASASSGTDAHRMLHRWVGRAQSGGGSSSEQHFRLRACLLQELVRCGRVQRLPALRWLNHSGIAKTGPSAHAITPFVYRFWSAISAPQAAQTDAQIGQAGRGFLGAEGADRHVDDTLLRAFWSFFECRLLWTKGLKDASIAHVNTKVIGTLKRLLLQLPDGDEYDGEYEGQGHGEGGKREQGQRDPHTARLHARNLLSQALRTGGEWVSTKRAATGTGILDDYFSPAAHYASGLPERIKAHSTLAAFHARLFQNFRARVGSAEWAQGARVLADRRTEYQNCRELQAKLRDPRARTEDTDAVDAKALYRHVATLRKEIDLDDSERQAVEASVNRHLLCAVADLSRVLEISHEADVDSVFRLVQLWMDNSDNAAINALMNEIVQRVPSYKFAPLSYQILSRLGGAELSPAESAHSQARLAEQLCNGGAVRGMRNPPSRSATACSTFSLGEGEGERGDEGEGEGGFQLVLARMVMKLAAQHPFHILPQLFALAHEREFGGTYDGAAHAKQNMSLARLETSKMLVGQLKAIAPLQSLVDCTQQMLLAYIDLANASTLAMQKSGFTKGIKYNKIQPRGKRFDQVMHALAVSPAVLTLSVKLSPQHDYSDVVRVSGFSPHFSITDNGISRPKIVSCLGSDGCYYTQLVKGGDDMRQDAVMQQVFDNVNSQLGQDEETQKRQLRVHTYRIVPLTPQTGVLEWVQDTTAFGSILTDKRGTHARYYPNDWTHSQCREHLKNALDNNDKLHRYREVCARFHPAFRFFFLERYADPLQWMAARLAYTRSVAANSIIGYVLGIGDRHAHN